MMGQRDGSVRAALYLCTGNLCTGNGESFRNDKMMPRIQPQRAIFLSLFVLLCLTLLGARPLSAQEEAPVNSGAVSPNDVKEIAKDLWCPLCSGVRLDACELKACEQMRDMIAVQLEEGQNKEQIKAYFLEQYGPQVMGEPPLQGFNLLAWILPFAALAGGGIFVWRRLRKMIVQKPQPAGVLTPAVEEKYHQQLEEELKRYG